jgi:hypothetical protein
MFENMMQRRICGPKRDDAGGGGCRRQENTA